MIQMLYQYFLNYVLVMIFIGCLGIVLYAESSDNNHPQPTASMNKPESPSVSIDLGEKPKHAEEKVWEYIKKSISKYPMVIQQPAANSVIVRLADHPADLFKSTEWRIIKNKPEQASNPERSIRELMTKTATIQHGNDRYVANIRIRQSTSSLNALKDTIYASSSMLSASRLNTWGGLDDVAPVPSAPFVANFAGGPYNSIFVSIGNLSIITNVSGDSGQQHLSLAELADLVDRLGQVVSTSPTESKAANPAYLKLERGNAVDQEIPCPPPVLRSRFYERIGLIEHAG